MKFLFAVVLSCMVALSFGDLTDEPANPACTDDIHPVGFQTDTIFCIGVPMRGPEDTETYYVKGKAWLGTVKAAEPYTICCDEQPPKKYVDTPVAAPPAPVATTKKPWWRF